MGKTHIRNREERSRAEVEALFERAVAEAPARGSVARRDGKPPPRMFEDLPLSSPTLSGLERGKFTRLTRIQQLAVPHALAGRDVLGAARTGSGKTLSFVIPMFERLHRNGWSAGMGVGAMIISPTRELALQIFEVIKVVGYRHTVVAGLVIGGSNFAKEQMHIHQIGVMVCTPGRVLQHLEQSPTLDAGQLEVFVLDEADRLLDMGFKDQLKQIIAFLPEQRQTLLFSATQTKSVKALATLSLSKPEYVSVVNNDGEKGGDDDSSDAKKAALRRVPTPANLMQAYSVVQLPQKLDVLFSFIRSHLQSKIIVFFSSCKQVKYVDAAFRKLRPGIPLMSIHGKIKQQKRMFIYYDFIKKPAAVLFATDIAARGLDFPSVDWVVQVDAPEDVASYIHRVGRTARYKSRGCALLLLLPNEAAGMVPLLRDANIPIVEKRVNPSKQQSVQRKLQSQLAGDAELKLNAQRAFKSYLRSVHLQPDKRVFDVKRLPMKAFAESLGLLNTPRIKIGGLGGDAGRTEHRAKKNVPHAMAKLEMMMMHDNEQDTGSNYDGKDEEDEDEDVIKLIEKLKSTSRHKVKKSKVERLLELKASSAVSQAHLLANDSDRSDNDSGEKGSDEDDDDDGLVFKRSQKPIYQDNDGQELALTDMTKVPSKKQLARLKLNSDGLAKGRAKPSRKVFNEDGEEQSPFAKLAGELADTANDNHDTVIKVTSKDRQLYLQQMREKLLAEDDADKSREKDRIKQKRLEAKLKLRAENETNDERPTAVLGGANDASDSDSSASGDDSNGSSDNDVDDQDNNAEDEELSSGDEDEGEELVEKKRSRREEQSSNTPKRSKLMDTDDMQAEALRLIATQGV